KAEMWVEANGGWMAETPRLAVEDADIVFMCVGNDDDVRSVVYGDDGVLGGMRQGSILVDHTTASAVLAREVAAAAKDHSIGFVDAPVSGGQAGAEKGALTVMCGADDLLVFRQARSYIMSYAKACEMMGGVGAGQLTKMVNQICIAGVVQGLSEA